MKTLKVCFIGYGSIAKRHIKNLHSLCKIKKIDLIIDILRHENFNNNKQEKFAYISEVKYKKLNPNDKYDIIFITNPTSEHYKALKKYRDNAKMFFVEKPLVSYNDLNKIKKLLINPNNIYVACPLRYKSVIQYIKNKVDLHGIICARAICSSYLPEWRPNIDYKKSYSANKNLGGGVRLDLIHEWDYLKYLFGRPKRIKYEYGKFSKLKIDTEDFATYIADYKDKILELHIDYFGRAYQRNIELYFEDDVLVIDLYKNTIKSLVNNKTISFNERRDNYQTRELIHFMDIFYKNIENDNNIRDSIATIELTRGKI